MGGDIDAERMRCAIEGMELEDTVAQLPEKEKTCMSTAYSPTGVELSGGQKQKLAIVRALYKNAPYIVLDEPTAALSPQSEFDLYQAFQEISHDKGVVYISHRFASCRLCDEIFVFFQRRDCRTWQSQRTYGDEWPLQAVVRTTSGIIR